MSDILQRADGYEIDSDFVTDKSETPNVYADLANTAVTYTEDMQTAKGWAKFDIKTDVERSQEEWEQKYGGMQEEQERLSRDNAGKTAEDILNEIQGRQENGSDTEQKQESDDREADRSYTDEDAEFYARREENDHSAEVITRTVGDDGEVIYGYYSNPEAYEKAIADGMDVGTAYVVDSDASNVLMGKWQSEGKAFNAVDYYNEMFDTATPYGAYKAEHENDKSESSVDSSDKSTITYSRSSADKYSSADKFDAYLAAHPDTEDTTENENDMELGS